MIRRTLALTLLVAAWLATVAPLPACGPFGVGAVFWPERRPGPEIDRFLAGELGILHTDLDPAYRFVAYRHLAGLGGAPEALATLWPPAEAPPESGLDLWREARGRLASAEPLGWLSPYRSETVGKGDTVLYLSYLNCHDDAFEKAAATLEARVERYGAGSSEVRAWLEAQDQVFANCGGGETTPPPLPEDADPLIRADRAYQIAAACFYSFRHAEAAERFEAIARDPTSPWRDLAAYLVARALVRDERYGEASEQLRAVLAEPRLADLHEAARRLLGYSELRADPGKRQRELAGRLLAPRLEAPLHQAFTDYHWLLDHHSDSDVPGAWLHAFARQPVDGEAPWAAAAERWRRQGGLAWLTAALVVAPPELPDVEALLAEAAKVPAGSPAYLTAAYHRARLLAALGRAGDARAVLDPLLEGNGDKSVGDRNRLRLLRAEVTPELDAYLRLATNVPFELGWDDGSGQLLTAGDGMPDFPDYRAGDPILADAAVELLNHGLTTREMLDLAAGDALPEPWRRRLALAAWTRAVATGDSAVALDAAPLVAALAPELEAEMAAFTDAAAADRPFQAAWTLLRFPGLTPVVRWNVGRGTKIDEIDSLRDNGWCAGVLESSGVPYQVVRSPEQIAALQASLPAGGLPAWPHFAGRLILARAEARPDDPRLPEALHRTVRATRYGCPAGTYGDVSRAAFQTLHRRFPHSPWAAKTPHWFD